MDETTKTVKIDIVADAKNFRNQLKQASSDANAFNKGIKDFKKAGLRQDKDLNKLSKDMAKFNKASNQEAIRHEKNLVNAMKKRSSELNKMLKAGEQETKQFKDKRKELGKMASLYSDIRKTREEEESRSLASRIKRGAMKVGAGALLGLGGAAIGAVTSRIGDANEAYTNFAKGGIGIAGSEIGNMSQAMMFSRFGRHAGYTPEETMSLMEQSFKQTGYAANVTEAQQFARAGALDASQSVGFMGLQARGGKVPGDQKKELEKILASAFATGLERGRFGEFLEGVTNLTANAQARAGGDVSGSAAANALRILGSTGQSGLKGARGASVLSQLEQGFMSGGGEAGRAISLRAMGFGSPGGGASFYEAEKRRQRGFTGEGGAENLKMFVQQLQKEYGADSQSAIIAANEMTGLSYDVLEKAFQAVNRGGEDADKTLETIAKESASLEQQMLDVLKTDLAGQTKRVADKQVMLVEQGQNISGSIKKMEDILNDVLTKVWPSVENTLEFIADVLKDSYDLWNDWIGDGSDRSATDRLKNEREAIQKYLLTNTGEAGSEFDKEIKSKLKGYNKDQDRYLMNRGSIHSSEYKARQKIIEDLTSAQMGIEGVQAPADQAAYMKEQQELEDIRKAVADRKRREAEALNTMPTGKGLPPEDFEKIGNAAGRAAGNALVRPLANATVRQQPQALKPR